jgi:hypothetical protein
MTSSLSIASQRTAYHSRSRPCWQSDQSRAPIINEAGVVVSIVQGGTPDDRVIWGFPLTDFVAALDRGPDGNKD